MCKISRNGRGFPEDPELGILLCSGVRLGEKPRARSGEEAAKLIQQKGGGSVPSHLETIQADL